MKKKITHYYYIIRTTIVCQNTHPLEWRTRARVFNILYYRGELITNIILYYWVRICIYILSDTVCNLIKSATCVIYQLNRTVVPMTRGIKICTRDTCPVHILLLYSRFWSVYTTTRSMRIIILLWNITVCVCVCVCNDAKGVPMYALGGSFTHFECIPSGTIPTRR